MVASGDRPFGSTRTPARPVAAAARRVAAEPLEAVGVVEHLDDVEDPRAAPSPAGRVALARPAGQVGA